ncbi:MAG: S1-like domain-containing RNA-binding protein [Odoribacter sp.]|nr:S1-like domain-containing RNA-binding protein [Odoribacter sp.]MDY3034286.1 S1-like domain-containing RNA-binding protein [Odoribacter sp.]
MVEIGRFNTLTVVKIVDFGIYLDGGERGEILMPKEYVPDNCFPDDEIKAFVYFDSEDRIIATTEVPYVQVGEFAFMKVVATSSVGAFLDWGLRKDLLVPFREQRDPMAEGKSYLVYAYVDKASDRIVASTKIDKYLDQVFPDYTPNQEVDILVARKTDLGYAVIVNNAHWGLIYDNEIFQRLKIGQRLKGYIKRVRDDEKIDVSLQPSGFAKIEGLAGEVLEKLKDYGGVLDISDKSDPEEIYNLFGCSKKNYKKALGTLLKQGLIVIGEKEIKLK